MRDRTVNVFSHIIAWCESGKFVQLEANLHKGRQLGYFCQFGYGDSESVVCQNVSCLAYKLTALHGPRGKFPVKVHR